MVKVGKCALIALMHKKWTLRVELTKKTSHCKSRDFLRKRRLKKTSHCKSRDFLQKRRLKIQVKLFSKNACTGPFTQVILIKLLQKL